MIIGVSGKIAQRGDGGGVQLRTVKGCLIMMYGNSTGWWPLDSKRKAIASQTMKERSKRKRSRVQISLRVKRLPNNNTHAPSCTLNCNARKRC